MESMQVVTPKSPQVIKAMQQKAIVSYGQINITTDSSTNINNCIESTNNKDVLLQVIEYQHKEIVQLLEMVERLQDKVLALREKSV